MKNKSKDKQLIANTNAAHEMFKTLNKLGFNVKFLRAKNPDYSWGNVYDCWQYARKHGHKDEI